VAIHCKRTQGLGRDFDLEVCSMRAGGCGGSLLRANTLKTNKSKEALKG